MKIVVWGIGLRGKRLYKILPKNTIIAFIDSNKAYENKRYNEIPIISLAEYQEKFSDFHILISQKVYQPLVKILSELGINSYSILSNEPQCLYRSDLLNINDYFELTVNKGKKYILKGFSMYSVLLYEYLKNNGNEVVFLSCDHAAVEQYFINKWQLKVILNAPKIMCKYDELIICDTSYEECVQQFGQEINCFDAVHGIKKLACNYYGDLEKFHNRYRGKRCFIVANGPSLSMDDLDTLSKNKEYSFGVNGVFLASEKTFWNPEFYVVTDVYYANLRWQEIIDYKSKYKFIVNIADKIWDEVLPYDYYKFYTEYYTPRISDYGDVGFADDIRYGLYNGGTVVHVCIQMAVYFGFNEIYIIGADTTSYKSSEKSHFIETYHDDITKVIQDPYLDIDAVVEGYKNIKRYTDKHGIKVYNATRGGALEVFDRVNFESLF